MLGNSPLRDRVFLLSNHGSDTSVSCVPKEGKRKTTQQTMNDGLFDRSGHKYA